MFQMSMDSLNVKLEQIIQEQIHLKLNTQQVVRDIIRDELDLQYETIN